MVIQTWQLSLIIFFFITVIVGIFIFLIRFKFKKAKDFAQKIGFVFFTQKNIPAEYLEVSKYLLYFWGFEFLSIGDVSGQKVYFTQYLQKRPSQLPYVYAIFSLFDTPYTFVSDEERKTLQARVERVAPGVLLTEAGIFYYHPIPWILKEKNILDISKKIVLAIQSLK